MARFAKHFNGDEDTERDVIATIRLLKTWLAVVSVALVASLAINGLGIVLAVQSSRNAAAAVARAARVQTLVRASNATTLCRGVNGLQNELVQYVVEVGRVSARRHPHAPRSVGLPLKLKPINCEHLSSAILRAK